MPSIELVCIGQRAPSRLPKMPFAIVTDTVPISHRGPRPLFRRELTALIGCTYHVGNPGADSPTYHGPYFAYDILSEKSQFPGRFFEVDARFRSAFKKLLRTLIDASPDGAVFFFTDWQFGPSRATRGGTLTAEEFWKRHDRHELKLNGCYIVRAIGRRPTSSAGMNKKRTSSVKITR
jgi:hypothetical protein